MKRSDVPEGADLPPPRNRPQLAVYEVVGVVAVEVDEPGLEQGLGHLLERPVHLPVELDLVVEGPEDGGDAATFILWRPRYGEFLDITQIQGRLYSGGCPTKAECLGRRTS